MEPALHRRAQRYSWDRVSSYYESFWQDQLRPAQNLLLELAGLQQGESVIDVACGTGLVSFQAVRKLGVNGRLLGTDISGKMVDLASSIALLKKENRAQFEWMDAENLELENNTFDAALCSLGLMYMPDPKKALEEMRRVLKPGGRVVAAVWGPREQCGWSEIFNIVDQYVSSEVSPMFFNLGRPHMLELHFKAAGFRHISIRRIRTVLYYEDDQQALGAAFVGGPVAPAYHKLSEETKREAHAAYLHSLIPYKKGESYEVPAVFVVARGYNS
jgi:ubiquinone/menaquinone biosynthesis C-methylase UbiE